MRKVVVVRRHVRGNVLARGLWENKYRAKGDWNDVARNIFSVALPPLVRLTHHTNAHTPNGRPVIKLQSRIAG